MQFYSKYNQDRINKSESPPLRHSCLYSDELGVYLLVSTAMENQLAEEFCQDEFQVFTSEDYVPSRKRENAISEYRKRDKYKGHPTGCRLDLNTLSSERIRQILL